MPTESSLRPSEMSIHRASSAPIAWVFELKQLQRIGGIALTINSEGRDPRFEAIPPTLLRHLCRRSQADTTVDRGETNAPLTSFAGSGRPPLFWIHAHPPIIRSSDHGRDAILVDVARQTKWKARAIAMRDEAFLFLIVWQSGRRAISKQALTR